jgi:hypothetical protein
LRQALLDAQPGDTITFDPAVFPPQSPVRIALESELPWLSQGHLTVDASDAGVILDGSRAGEEWTGGVIIDSEGNTLRGLQILHFTGAGIILRENAGHNIIGGDREVGSGPLGQGNLSSDNADGLGLFGARANTILGNLVGTDVTGQNPLANRVAGMFLQDGARENVIGPDNVIAFNGDIGVDVRTEDSTGNTITGNAIHDNAVGGIRLPPGAGFAPSPPVLWDFDLAAGTLAGAASDCAGCRIEIFSDGGNQGAVCEAQVAADSKGAFALSVGRPLAGPSLTATVTTANGATSAFSDPTAGAERVVPLLQEASRLPRALFISLRTDDLEPNQIGETHSGIRPISADDDPAWLSQRANERGFSWIRMSFSEFDWSLFERDGVYSPLSFGDYHDQFVDSLNQAGITILYNLTFFDETLEAGPGFSRFKTEEEVQAYLDYVRMVVTHFKGRIQYYETWNEPDLANYGQQGIAVEDYISVIRRLVPVIHEADPQAKLVVNGGADLRHPITQAYLMTLLQSDIMPLVDALSLHSMYGSCPDCEELRQYYYGYPALIERLKETASAHGFDGEWFAEEMVWRMPFNTTDYDVWTYSETVAAKYYVRGIVINRGLGLWAGIGGECYDCVPVVLNTVRNVGTVLSGAQPAELPLEVESEADLIRSYTFSLTNGDRLVAIWTDGVGVDFDPGVAATVTLPGMSASQAVAIDVLYGFEQELIADAQEGNLTLPNLLVKDYPVFVRLGGVAAAP